MNKRKLLIGFGLGVVLATAITTTAHAATMYGDTASCRIVHEFGVGKGFTAIGNTVSINTIVAGDAKTCRKDVVLASFKVPHDTLTPYPLEDQKLFDYDVIRGVGPGTYKMTVKVPNCFHQVDQAVGKNPTGPNGRLPYEAGRMRNAYMGGTEKCEKKTPPVTPPVTPPTPPAPTPEVPAALPKTGPASVASGVLSVSALSGAAHYIVSRRRSLRK